MVCRNVLVNSTAMNSIKAMNAMMEIKVRVKITTSAWKDIIVVINITRRGVTTMNVTRVASAPTITLLMLV